MKLMKPIIGISPHYLEDEYKITLNRNYYEGILRTGGVPVVIPTTINKELLDDYIDRCDGFLITGGFDVNPKYYNETSNKFIGSICPYRDEMEIYIVKKVFSLNKSVLGICRGMQIINVALGGALYQDIHHQMKDKEIEKHFQEAPRWFVTQEVKIKENTKLFNIFNTQSLYVNSFHHQSVKTLGENLLVTANSKDGIIEAIEHNEHKFLLGVQWHPETLINEYKEFLSLFKSFVDSCK